MLEVVEAEVGMEVMVTVMVMIKRMNRINTNYNGGNGEYNGDIIM